MADLNQDKIDSRREVPFEINLKGIYKAYQNLFFDQPVNAFRWLTRNTERLSKKMMSGVASVVTVPAGIMIRNASTVAHQTINDKDHKYSWVGNIGAAAGAGAAWWLTGTAIFSKLAFGTSIAAKVGAVIVASVASAPVLAPALAVGVIVAGTAMGTGTFAASLLPALANLKVGFLRTMDRIRGVKYSPEVKAELQKSLEKDSISTDYDKRRYDDARRAYSNLKKEDQIRLFESLKDAFEKEAQKTKPKAVKKITPPSDAPSA